MKFQKIEINGFLGRENFELNLEEVKIPILVGPNGCGKTTLLKLIKATLEGDIKTLLDVDFTSIKVTIDNKNNIEVIKNVQLKFYDFEKIVIQVASSLSESEHLYFKDMWLVQYNIEEDGKSLFEKNENSVFLDMPEIKMFRRRYVRSFEKVGLEKLEKRGLDLNNLFLYNGKRKHKYSGVLHQELKRFSKKTNIIFIEANRLLSRGGEGEKRIDEVASGIKEILNESLSKFSYEAQKIDKTFPIRVIREMESNTKEYNIKNLNKNFEKLNKKRDELVAIGLLNDNLGQVDIDKSTNLNSNMLSVLNLYIEDMDKKFNIFREEELKLKLFLEIINDKMKFYKKKMVISREYGVTFKLDEAGKILVRHLSSGEKNLLILFYELLFNTQEDTIVLVDEPEISLHIDWQEIFIKILIEIQKVKNIYAIVATHSPEIISEYSDYMISIGEEDV